MSKPKSWQEMRTWIVELLERNTGEGLEVWNARVQDTGIAGEPELRGWLKEQGVEGYAQIKPTTKSRVDLGLRLDGVRPGGRLASAKLLNDDAMTVRVPLTRPDEVDDEVGASLARAYEQNT